MDGSKKVALTGYSHVIKLQIYIFAAHSDPLDCKLVMYLRANLFIFLHKLICSLQCLLEFKVSLESCHLSYYTFH